MRYTVAVAAVVALGCSKRSELSTQRSSNGQSPPSGPVTEVAAATPPPQAASVKPCVVRVELTKSGVTITGADISGSDVTLLRKVANQCSALLVSDDNVTFEEVTRMLGLIEEQGIDEVRLGQPTGQWMSMDLERVTKLWKVEPAARLLAAVKENGPRMGAAQASVVAQVASLIASVEQHKAMAEQTSDRGLFEAVAQIVGLHRATSPVAMDLLERIVMPALQIDVPPTFASPSLAGSGLELFEMFVAGASKRTIPSGRGLLATIPDADLSTPYVDDKPYTDRAIDWVVVAVTPLAARLENYDEHKLVVAYDRFVDSLKRRDVDRLLVDTATRALADLRNCVTTAVQNRDALLFRALPPPVVRLAVADDRNLATVVIKKTAILVNGESATRSLLASLSQTSPRTIVVEAERTITYGRIRSVAAALGTPGYVTFVLRPR